ncbi:hypothetical protein [Streptomyces flavofungini]|uniref:hypothetical protein n=1 Tax=Streptomyces flavofungini TaxID=68200 RepID=UPI0034DF117F
MNRTTKMIVTLALAVAATGAAASTALADSHVPAPPRDGRATLHGDSHIPVAPLGDSHIPAPPRG